MDNIKEINLDSEQDEYYILSLTNKNPEMLLFWGPNNSGYTYDLNEAGKYNKVQVKSRQYYYNNGVETKAILCKDVDKMAIRCVPVDLRDQITKIL